MIRIPDIHEQTTDLPELETKCPVCGKPSVFLYSRFAPNDAPMWI